MEPLHPELRADLKRAHPGLDDRTIDNYENLTSLRFGLDPERDKARLAEIDTARLQLLRNRMPHYAKVREAFLVRKGGTHDTAAPPPVHVEWRKDDDTTDGADSGDSESLPKHR